MSTRPPRHYSTTKEFATNSGKDLGLGLSAIKALGLVAAILSLIFAATGAVIAWYVSAGITVLIVGFYIGCLSALRTHSKKLQAALDDGPLITIADDVLTYSGTPALWSDIIEIHVADFRKEGPIAGMGEVGEVSLDIEFANAVHSVELDTVLPSGIITVMLTDLESAAAEHGIPFGTSRTNREYNAWVKAGSR